MAANWEQYLKRWVEAGLIENNTAELIRAYQTEQDKERGLRWPVIVAIAFGALTLASGILLFVAAHWDKISPGQRFGLIILLIVAIHLAGAFAANRFGVLSTAMHAVGTVCLGAGIYMAGQIFHLQEHWPGGVLLWTLGAWVGWALLKDWVQASLAAILTPVWLASEWLLTAGRWEHGGTILGAGILTLAITYFTALTPDTSSYVRKALSWIGGIILIPASGLAICFGSYGSLNTSPMPPGHLVFGWGLALLLPLVLAWLLRGRRVWLNVIAALWVVALSISGIYLRGSLSHSLDALPVYVLCALGSVGLVAWGMKEHRKERINLGILGFALTILTFYFSTMMDKLGRSASLVGLGLLFLLGGWFLEKARRRLLGYIKRGDM